ncbi:MAG: ATP synthase F0 subunit B [bacterium]
MLLQIDGTFIVIGVSFLVFMFIMQVIFYGPMFKIKKQRQDYIEENERHAKVMAEAADNFIQTQENELKETRLQSKEILSQAVQGANLSKEQTIKKANGKALETLGKEKERITKTKLETKESLNNEISSLADEIVSKVLD